MLEWLAAMCFHVPNKGEQMVRYYGQLQQRGVEKTKKTGADDTTPCILEPELSNKAFRKNWAHLINKFDSTDGCWYACLFRRKTVKMKVVFVLFQNGYLAFWQTAFLFIVPGSSFQPIANF